MHSSDSEGVYNRHQYGIRNAESERIPRVRGVTLTSVICNTTCDKRGTRPITFVSGEVKSETDFFLIR